MNETPTIDQCRAMMRKTIASHVQIWIALAILIGFAAVAYWGNYRRDALSDQRNMAAWKEAMDDQKHLFDVMVRAVEDPVVEVDYEGRVLWRNDAAHRVLGVQTGQPVHTIFEAYGPKFIEKHRQAVRKAGPRRINTVECEWNGQPIYVYTWTTNTNTKMALIRPRHQPAPPLPGEP